MNRDRLGSEIKLIFEEEAKNIELSQELRDGILKYRKKSIKEKINEFLNKEIEMPLVPVVAVFVLVLLISAFPKDIFKNEDIDIIDIGSSEVIVRVERGLRDND